MKMKSSSSFCESKVPPQTPATAHIGQEGSPRGTQAAMRRQWEKVEKEQYPALWKVSSIQRLCSRILTNRIFSAWMLVLTLYALFGYDIRLALTARAADSVFFASSALCFGFFLLELVLASLARRKYWLSFYFWLDVVSCVSMLADVGWVWNLFMDAAGSPRTGLLKSSQIVRAARGSRAGTRASRIFSLVRGMRFLRSVRLYRLAQERSLEPEEATTNTTPPRCLNRSLVAFRGLSTAVAPTSLTPEAAGMQSKVDWWEAEKGKPEIDWGSWDAGHSDMTPFSSETSSPQDTVPFESTVGRELSDRITKRIISLVLGMLFLLPYFSPSMYRDDNSSYDYGLRRIDHMADLPGFERVWEEFIAAHSARPTPLVYLEVSSLRVWATLDLGDLRDEEKREYVIECEQGSRHSAYAVEDMRPATRLQAGVNMLKTIFLCGVMVAAAFFFSKDANVLLVSPLEVMVQKIRKMSENPLEAVQREELVTLVLEESRRFSSRSEQMEPEVLNRAIAKIGALLVLGFGEAGAEVISSSIRRGDVDPLAEGRKAYCIFGFCGISNYAALADILQEDVLHYVNDIALIVHRTVHQFLGAANKNVGESFLLVWKVPASTFRPGAEAVPYELTQLADMAAIAFLKVQAALSSETRLRRYHCDPRIAAVLPNFSVRLGFGLHVGWAIEGSIGSCFKVEVSYLSPSVNLAARLESATKQFGVPLLFSGALFDLMSQQMQSFARQIDCVRVKGSAVPLRVYTVDTCATGVPDAKEEPYDWERKTDRLRRRHRRERLWDAIVSQREDASRLFETDSQLLALRHSIKPKFLHHFHSGFTAYLAGDWHKARRDLLYAVEIKGEEDGPTRVLLEFMESLQGECPARWKGCRELREK